MYYFALLRFFIVVGIALLAYVAIRRYRTWRLWQKVRKTPLPRSWREVLEKNPHYRRLCDTDRERLRPKMLYFAHTKEFMGVKLEVTEEMKAVISFYACLMVLNIPGECFEKLITILLYPYDVVARRIEAKDGIYEEGEFLLEGQSSGDIVVIAWNEAKREISHPGGHNVIVHELAHVLDARDGVFDGMPPLESAKSFAFGKILYRRYKRLRSRYEKERGVGRGPYAATDEAEFFAVLCELFFQRPAALRKHFPDLYGELADFFRLDTVELFGDLEKDA